MRILVHPRAILNMTFHDISSQDLDGNGTIGFKVCSFPPPECFETYIPCTVWATLAFYDYRVPKCTLAYLTSRITMATDV